MFYISLKVKVRPQNHKTCLYRMQSFSFIFKYALCIIGERKYQTADQEYSISKKGLHNFMLSI